MTVQQGAAEADVKIRTVRRVWMPLFVFGGFWLVLAAVEMAAGQPALTLQWVVLGVVVIAEAFWIRTFGVDLTRESAMVRGLRRRSVLWQEVQAVVRHRRLEGWVVRLILDSGRPVTLRAPTSLWGLGEAEYERDVQRIEQWWLAHRGESWHPVSPEAPRPPIQG